MHIRDTDDGDELTLNLTPMIDVVFLLLIFFMVATSFIDPEKEMDVDLPPALSGDALDEAPDEITINIMRDGRYLVAGAEVDRAGLDATLERAARRNPETPVTIRGDRLVHYEKVVSVMDACGVAGLTNLAVGTTDADGG